MANLIKNNAYRILGLDTAAGQKDILKRSKEIINHLKIDDHPKYDIDIEVPDKARNEEAVKDAIRALQSPKDSIKEYFFWFQISNNNDKKALVFIADGEISRAIELWKGLSDNDTPAAFTYKKNLAILYCLLLLKNDTAKYLNGSLSLWKEITDSEKFWTSFSKSYNEQNEQTLEEENLAQFKEIIIKEISDIYTDLGQLNKNTDYIKEFQEIFGSYGEGTKKTVLQPAYNEINDKIAELMSLKIVDGDPKIEEIDSIVDAIKKSLAKLRKTGLYEAPESKVIRDHVAEAIRAKSVELHNDASAFEDSVRLVKVAASISGTESFKSTLKGDEEKIEKSIEMDKSSVVSVVKRGIFSTKSAEFKPRFVEYEGKRILYKDICWITYNGVKSNYSTTYYFTVNAGETNISFSLSDLTTWQKVIGLSIQLIFPVIIKKYSDLIFEKNGSVTIGELTFSKKGFSRQKFFGGTDSVDWKETIYIPVFSAGNVLVYKEREGKQSFFSTIPMTTPNAVVLPQLLQECVNRAFALGLIPAKSAPPAPKLNLQLDRSVASGPAYGTQEYYDAIDKAQRPELLKAFTDAGGEKMPKSWLEALRRIRSDGDKGNFAVVKSMDGSVIKSLLAKGYIKEEKGVMSSKYTIQKKGWDILNWDSYKFK
jgi:hypothetical protein